MFGFCVNAYVVLMQTYFALYILLNKGIYKVEKTIILEVCKNCIDFCTYYLSYQHSYLKYHFFSI